MKLPFGGAELDIYDAVRLRDVLTERGGFTAFVDDLEEMIESVVCDRNEIEADCGLTYGKQVEELTAALKDVEGRCIELHSMNEEQSETIANYQKTTTSLKLQISNQEKNIDNLLKLREDADNSYVNCVAKLSELKDRYNSQARKLADLNADCNRTTAANMYLRETHSNLEHEIADLKIRLSKYEGRV